MGVDLRLLPYDADWGTGAFSHTILSCERRRELWEDIAKLPALPVDAKNFTCFASRKIDDPDAEDGYGRVYRDPYGEPMQYVTAQSLCRLSRKRAVRDNHTNRAIWAYLAQLPRQTKVALYWH